MPEKGKVNVCLFSEKGFRTAIVIRQFAVGFYKKRGFINLEKTNVGENQTKI